jgi:hypothetical protein
MGVVFMNIFFVYFSILRAFERGYAWQRMFALACMVQFLVEVIVYETTECAMVHFLIPDLVRAEVQGAGVALRSIVSQLCTSQSFGLASVSSSSNVKLDAPNYLFVSINVAKRYPDMLESVLIRSYHTCWPGPYATKWRFDQFSDSKWLFSDGGGRMASDFFRTVSVTAILISLLKEFGASAPVLQRLILHSIQPLFVAAIFFIGSIFLIQPLYWLLLIPVIVYGVYSYRKYQWQVSQDGDGGDIHPMKESHQTQATKSQQSQLADVPNLNLPATGHIDPDSRNPPTELKISLLSIVSAPQPQPQGAPLDEEGEGEIEAQAEAEGEGKSEDDEFNLEFSAEGAISDDLSANSFWDEEDEDESSAYARRRRLSSSDSYYHDSNTSLGNRRRASSVFSSYTVDSPSESQEQENEEDDEDEDAYSESSLYALSEEDSPSSLGN